MGSLRRFAVCALILLFVAPGIMAAGFENTGVGTTASAMGGAFRGIADDWTAAYYNPAGYAYMYDNEVGGNVSFLHFRNEIVPNYRYGNTYESGIINDQSLYNKHEVLNNPSAGIVLRFPVWGETVFGFSAYQPFDQNVEWTLYEPSFAYNQNLYGNFPDNQYMNNLDVVAFQLTAAREFSADKLAIGLGLQLLRADLNYNTLVFRENPLESPLSDRPRDRITQWVRHDASGWGFGLNLGIMFKASEKLNVGVSASLPFAITVDGSSMNTYFMPYNEQLDEQTTLDIDNVGNMFVNGRNQTYEPDTETEIKLPPSFGIGFAFTASEKLLLSLDASYVMWSQFEGFEFTYSGWNVSGYAADPSIIDFFTADLTFPTEFKDAGKIALGARYLYSEQFTFLGGISADQSANPDVIGFMPQFIDTGDKYRYSFGTIYSIEQWDVGLTTSYTHYPDLIVGGLSDLDGDGTFDSFPGEYKAETWETTLSFKYRF